jgi:LPS-assembly protein
MATNFMLNYPRAALFVLCASACCAPAQAGEEALCRPLAEMLPAKPVLDRQPRGNELLLSSERGVLEQDAQTARFSGGVIAQRGAQVLRAENLVYRKTDDETEASGDVTLWDPHFVVHGHQAKLFGEDRGEAWETEYWLTERRGRGRAEEVLKLDRDRAQLKETTYTTCDPGAEAWRLRSRETTLDFSENTGEAWGVTLYLADVPVLYTPYLNFPLGDGRKSGFLIPRLGYSNSTGLDLAIPYYWNMAPNYDATLTPRVMSKRGLMLESEFRYLTQTSRGQVGWEYLPNDESFDGERSFVSLTHTTRFTPRLNLNLLYQEASDIHYFEDLGSNLSLSSVTHLPRSARLSYRATLGKQNYLTQLALTDYQSLSANPRATQYARLPQLTLRKLGREQNRKLNYNLSGEYVYFQRDWDLPESIRNPEGSRVDARFGLSYPLRYAAGFFVPKASFQATRYTLDGLLPAEGSGDFSRTLPILSADAGLFFEREFEWGGRSLLQTLEPRVFYLYVPYRDQRKIPLFDTSEYDFSFGQLFREDRFSGPDRVGDDHRLSLAVSSRFMGRRDAVQHLRLSLGQIIYLRDRQVGLGTKAPESEDTSELVAEVAAQLTKEWSLLHTLQWQPEDGETHKSTVRLRYRPKPGQSVSLAYRYRQASFEQTDLSWQWPINPRWSMLGRWNYALRENKNLESFLGLQYESCCYAVRAVARRYLRNLQGDYQSAVFFQVELKGLGGLGRKTAGFLREHIPEFEDGF